jgi:hypothetical protein
MPGHRGNLSTSPFGTLLSAVHGNAVSLTAGPFILDSRVCRPLPYSPKHLDMQKHLVNVWTGIGGYHSRHRNG